MALALGQAQQFFLRLQLALHLRSLKLTLQRGQTCLLFLRLYLLGYRPEDTLGLQPRLLLSTSGLFLSLHEECLGTQRFGLCPQSVLLCLALCLLACLLCLALCLLACFLCNHLGLEGRNLTFLFKDLGSGLGSQGGCLVGKGVELGGCLSLSKQGLCGYLGGKGIELGGCLSLGKQGLCGKGVALGCCLSLGEQRLVCCLHSKSVELGGCLRLGEQRLGCMRLLRRRLPAQRLYLSGNVHF